MTPHRQWTVAVFVVHRGRVLLLRHRRYGKWLPPGGHVRPDELPDEAALREVYEETGLSVELLGEGALPLAEPRQLIRPEGIQVERVAPDREHIDIIYFARLRQAFGDADAGEPPSLRLNHEAETGGWYARTDLQRMELTDEIRRWAERALAAGDATALVECVPNFSEGRRPEVVEAIRAAMAAIPGVAVLDVSRDPDYHRSVITLAGAPRAVVEAAFAGAREAVVRIDLRAHRGIHPRIGAVDVIPLVPLAGVELTDLVPLARELGERIARDLGVPVYLYAAAATTAHPAHRELSFLRRGGFEGLAQAMATDPERRPDIGPSRPHPTAGATAVGARTPLIAFNVELDTPDVGIARAVAARVRESGGGLPKVRAIGVRLEQRATTQVSMNLLDYRTTPIHRALESVRAEARRHGAQVIASEIVGLVPEDALLECAEYYLGLRGPGWHRGQVLERRLREAGLVVVGRDASRPAGGAVEARGSGQKG